MKRLLLIAISVIFVCACNVSDTTPVYTLQTSVHPEQGGTVSPDSGHYEEGEHILIEARADSGYVFTGWSGDLSGENNPDSLYFDSDKQITAIFEEENDPGDNGNGEGSDDPPNSYTVTTSTEGNGSVSLDPDKEEYEEGEVVTVKANSDDGWKFSHWRGDLSGDANPQTFSIEKDTDITAVFEENEPDEPEEYSVDINVKNNEGGSVEINPDRGSYEEGEEITVTANPDANWEFVEWEGDFSGSENPLLFNIDGDKIITAVFREKESDGDPDTTYYTLHRQTEGKGTVWWEPYSETDEIPEGTELTIGANAADGWEFSHWEGDFQGSTNPIEGVLVDRDITFTAVFEETDDAGPGPDPDPDPEPEFFSITTETRGEGEITIDPGAPEYEEGSEIVVEAVAGDGWEFSHWEGDFSGSENPVIFEIDQDKFIIAVFEQMGKVIEAGEVSHGFIPGFTPSNDAEFQNRTYPVIQANWEGEGGDKRWTARNLGATDDPQGFQDNDPHRAGWYFYFNDSQGHFWDGQPALRRPSWTTPTIYGGSSGDADFRDPCKALGDAWRTPNVAEWKALAAADVADEMNFHEGGALNDGGKYAGSGTQDVSRYWSSEQVGTRPEYIYFEVHSNGEITQELQYGYVRDILTVRCIED